MRERTLRQAGHMPNTRAATTAAAVDASNGRRPRSSDTSIGNGVGSAPRSTAPSSARAINTPKPVAITARSKGNFFLYHTI